MISPSHHIPLRFRRQTQYSTMARLRGNVKEGREERVWKRFSKGFWMMFNTPPHTHTHQTYKIHTFAYRFCFLFLSYKHATLETFCIKPNPSLTVSTMECKYYIKSTHILSLSSSLSLSPLLKTWYLSHNRENKDCWTRKIRFCIVFTHLPYNRRLSKTQNQHLTYMHLYTWFSPW